MPAAYCLTQQQPVLVQAPYLQALTRLVSCTALLQQKATHYSCFWLLVLLKLPYSLLATHPASQQLLLHMTLHTSAETLVASAVPAAPSCCCSDQACPASLMSVAIDMCARSLGDTMEALQAVSQLCAICSEAAATDSALSHAEQLMAGTIKKIRLTLRLAFLIKQQQQYKQLQQQQGPQGYVYEKEAAAVLPVAVAQWDPSTADSACSGYARLASLQYYAPVTEAASCMLLPVEQQSQQRQEVAKLAHQDAGLQEEVASSWE
jgi:hypothetical protein